MKNASKKNWLAPAKLLLLLVFLAPVRAGFSLSPAVKVTCDPPNVSITDKSSGTVSFAWDPVQYGNTYKIWYHRSEDDYTSSQTTTGSTTITYSNLPAGTYDFYFMTVCGEGNSIIVIEDDLMM